MRVSSEHAWDGEAAEFQAVMSHVREVEQTRTKKFLEKCAHVSTVSSPVTLPPPLPGREGSATSAPLRRSRNLRFVPGTWMGSCGSRGADGAAHSNMILWASQVPYFTTLYLPCYAPPRQTRDEVGQRCVAVPVSPTCVPAASRLIACGGVVGVEQGSPRWCCLRALARRRLRPRSGLRTTRPPTLACANCWSCPRKTHQGFHMCVRASGPGRSGQELRRE